MKDANKGSNLPTADDAQQKADRRKSRDKKRERRNHEQTSPPGSNKTSPKNSLQDVGLKGKI